MTINFDYGLKPLKRGAKPLPRTRKEYPGNPLACPACGHGMTVVTDSRARKDYRHRRRSCPKCGARFTTREYVKPDNQAVLQPPHEFPQWLFDTIVAEWRRNNAKVAAGEMA